MIPFIRQRRLASIPLVISILALTGGGYEDNLLTGESGAVRPWVTRPAPQSSIFVCGI